jgi:hypothetical protein
MRKNHNFYISCLVILTLGVLAFSWAGPLMGGADPTVAGNIPVQTANEVSLPEAPTTIAAVVLLALSFGVCAIKSLVKSSR